MQKGILAALVAALMVAPMGLVGADGTTTFTGFLVGGTQAAYTGAPTEIATHAFETGGDCTHTVTFSYNGIGGDTFFGEDGSRLLVTGGKDYLTHFYLFVEDGAGNLIDGGEWIEDDAWESGSLVGAAGAFPVMTHTATISGVCGTWTFIVDAHRGAAEYTIEIA